MKRTHQATQSKTDSSGYWFTGNADGLATRIPALVTEARVEVDKHGAPYVTAQAWLGVVSRPTEVTMTIQQALEAGIIEKIS